MATSKTLSIKWPKRALMVATIFFLLSLFSLLLLIDPVAAFVGERFEQPIEAVKDFARSMALGWAGLGMITIGLKLAVLVPWLGIPIVIIGLVAVGFALWRLNSQFDNNDKTLT